MARSLFKSMALVKTEDMQSEGGPIRIAKLLKQQPQFKSAWIDYVKVSCIVDDIASLPDEYITYNFMITVTNQSAAPTSLNMVTCEATGHGGGTVYLKVKRRIVDDDYDENSGEGALAIYAELPDVTATANITGKFAIEAFGRWHQVEAA